MQEQELRELIQKISSRVKKDAGSKEFAEKMSRVYPTRDPQLYTTFFAIEVSQKILTETLIEILCSPKSTSEGDS